jgi:hypothetical protein
LVHIAYHTFHFSSHGCCAVEEGGMDGGDVRERTHDEASIAQLVVGIRRFHCVVLLMCSTQRVRVWWQWRGVVWCA